MRDLQVCDGMVRACVRCKKHLKLIAQQEVPNTRAKVEDSGMLRRGLDEDSVVTVPRARDEVGAPFSGTRWRIQNLLLMVIDDDGVPFHEGGVCEA